MQACPASIMHASGRTTFFFFFSPMAPLEKPSVAEAETLAHASGGFKFELRLRPWRMPAVDSNLN